MSMQFPDPFEGWYVPLIAILLMAVSYTSYPKTTFVVGVLTIILVVAGILLLARISISINVAAAILVSGAAAAMYYQQIPLLAILGILVAGILFLGVQFLLYSESEVHALVLAIEILVSLATLYAFRHFLLDAESGANLAFGVFISSLLIAFYCGIVATLFEDTRK